MLGSGTVLIGPELEAFEHELALLLGHRHTVCVSSGASALQLALRALGVRPGDEVIVPAFTAVPTASAVCALGATPVLGRRRRVDRGASTRPPPPTAITSRTRAIVPVHLYGRPLDVDPLVGARHPDRRGRRPGPRRAAVDHRRGRRRTRSTRPRTSAASVTAARSATDDDDLAEAVRRLRVHGMTEQYVHVDISQNFRMSEIEAAWLRLQLARLDVDNARRRAIARHYREAAPQLRWHDDHPDHVFHLCVARVADRDRVRAELGAAGVQTSVHYPLAITQQPAYRSSATPPCPVAEAWAAECVSVPCFPELTDDEVETVASALARVAGSIDGVQRDDRATHGPIGLGVLPLLQRRALDLDDGPRRPALAGRARRRLRDHRRRRRIGRRVVRGARPRSPTMSRAARRPPRGQPRLRRSADLGFAASTKEWVFYTDGDAQYDATELVRCIDAVTADIDVVQGWKIGRGDPWYRKVIGRTYHHVVQAPVPPAGPRHRLRFPPHPPHACSTRVELTSTSGVICVEMMRNFDRAGARFVEVGVSHHPARTGGRSSSASRRSPARRSS